MTGARDRALPARETDGERADGRPDASPMTSERSLPPGLAAQIVLAADHPTRRDASAMPASAKERPLAEADRHQHRDHDRADGGHQATTLTRPTASP